MTEAEWFCSHDVGTMLPLLREWGSSRKLRLIACGCCRTSSWFTSLVGAGTAVEMAELWADGLAIRSAVLDAVQAIDVALSGSDHDFTRPAVEMGLCAEDPYVAVQYTFPWIGTSSTRARLCSNLLRCVIGNPYKYDPAPGTKIASVGLAKRIWAFAKELTTESSFPRLPGDLLKPNHRQQSSRMVSRPVPKLQFHAQAWLTSDVIALATQMYELREFSGMPILADALQDAGCDNEDILAHCRGDGPHVRGCWVVDLVLGKS